MQFTGVFEVCVNGSGIFSSLLFLTPLPPNIGGEICYNPLYSLGFYICSCLCWGRNLHPLPLSPR